MIFKYKGGNYPDYLKTGNACQFIAPIALQFCKGDGLDIGAGQWPLHGATPHEIKNGGKAEDLPDKQYDYLFSSHCLEHLVNPVQALEHWKTRLKPDGVLFLYLPHPEMEYWLPQNCRKHLHSWRPADMAKILRDIGFSDVLYSERDLMWSFAIVGTNKDLNAEQTDIDTKSPFKKKVEALVNERLHHILDDKDMLSLYQTFGAGIFRRSSIFHNLNRFLIKNNIKGKTCLEIGTFHGITAVVLSRYFEHVISVDVLDSKYKQPVLDHLGIKNVEFRLVADNTAKAELVKNLKFDFAYMDGDHENDTRLDWELTKGCGTVLFHEYWQEQPPVWDLVNSLPQHEVKIAGCLALWKRGGVG